MNELEHPDEQVIVGELEPPGRQPRVCWISPAPNGVRFRHRYHRDVIRWAWDIIPQDVRVWDSSTKAFVISDEGWADRYVAQARAAGFVIREDDFTAETRRPKGYRRTWADNLGGYLPLEHRAAVLGEIAEVLERHAGGDVPAAEKPAVQLRKYLEWNS